MHYGAIPDNRISVLTKDTKKKSRLLYMSVIYFLSTVKILYFI